MISGFEDFQLRTARSSHDTARKPSPQRSPMIPLISADAFDFWLQRLNPALSVSRTLARLVARTVVAHDTIQLTFAPNRAFRGARPGQHITLTAEVDGRQLTRCYSVTSLPQRGRRFDLVVKRLTHGRMSSFLTQRLRIGEAVQIGQAFGEMQAEPADPTPRLLLAGGVGITPLLAQIRESAGAGRPARQGPRRVRRPAGGACARGAGSRCRRARPTAQRTAGWPAGRANGGRWRPARVATKANESPHDQHT
jgi:hypothetical protein